MHLLKKIRVTSPKHLDWEILFRKVLKMESFFASLSINHDIHGNQITRENLLAEANSRKPFDCDSFIGPDVDMERGGPSFLYMKSKLIRALQQLTLTHMQIWN